MNSKISDLKKPMSVQAASSEFGIPPACIAELARSGTISSDQFFPPKSDKSVMLVERDEIKNYRMDGRSDEQ